MRSKERLKSRGGKKKNKRGKRRKKGLSNNVNSLNRREKQRSRGGSRSKKKLKCLSNSVR